MFNKMFKKKEKKEENKLEPTFTPEEKEEPVYNVSIEEDNNLVRIVISDSLPSNVFFDKLNKISPENRKLILKLPFGLLLTQNMTIQKGIYIGYNINDKTFVVVSNEKELIINEKIVDGEEVEEKDWSFDKNDNSFVFHKLIHDKESGTSEHKIYAGYQDSSSELEEFALTKEEAKKGIRELFNDLTQANIINEELSKLVNIEEMNNVIVEWFKEENSKTR
jgi:hypothetical protein